MYKKMNEKLVINEKVCLKYKMTLQEAIIALAIRNTDAFNEIPNMLNRGILVEDKTEDWYKITQHWSDVLDEILADSGGNTKTDEELKELAKRMIDAYPHGAMIDRRTGKPTSYFFQCNNYEVRAKLKSFYAKYGEYSDEEILNAEKRYVARWHGNYQQVGFRQLKYFIFKKDKDTGEISSPLLDFLENKESEEGVEITQEDWLLSSRN